MIFRKCVTALVSTQLNMAKMATFFFLEGLGFELEALHLALYCLSHTCSPE
jgi:hypothetical protein